MRDITTPPHKCSHHPIAQARAQENNRLAADSSDITQPQTTLRLGHLQASPCVCATDTLTQSEHVATRWTDVEAGRRRSRAGSRERAVRDACASTSTCSLVRSESLALHSATVSERRAPARPPES